MNHYQTLNVSQTATQEEIKKAYRSLAMQHHPDRGGDQSKFKDISVAYETLSDPQKKAEYDMQQAGGSPGGFGFKFHTGEGFQDMHEMFGGSPFGAHFHDIFGRQIRKNRDLNIQCRISLVDAFQGKQVEANFNLPSGKAQHVVINIPAGVEHGTTIRYQGLGDDSTPQLPRGNLNVTIIVLSDNEFRREGMDLYTNCYVNPIEAMIGCKKKVKTLTGQELELTIRPGVEHGTEFASANQGFPNINGQGRGRFVTVINIRTPAVIDKNLVDKLKKINEEINNI